jgi:hypothetical protein
MAQPEPGPAVERRPPPRRLVRLVNPLVRRLVAKGVGADQLLVLHLRGRRTGRAYDLPVGYYLVDGVMTVLTDSAWRHNVAEPTEVAATVAGVRRPFRASLQDDPDEVAGVLAGLVARLGVTGPGRRLGLRVRVDRPPTRDELADLVRRTGLTAVRLEPV